MTISELPFIPSVLVFFFPSSIIYKTAKAVPVRLMARSIHPLVIFSTSCSSSFDVSSQSVQLIRLTGACFFLKIFHFSLLRLSKNRKEKKSEKIRGIEENKRKLVGFTTTTKCCCVSCLCRARCVWLLWVICCCAVFCCSFLLLTVAPRKEIGKKE